MLVLKKKAIRGPKKYDSLVHQSNICILKTTFVRLFLMQYSIIICLKHICLNEICKIVLMSYTIMYITSLEILLTHDAILCIDVFSGLYFSLCIFLKIIFGFPLFQPEHYLSGRPVTLIS